MSSRKLSYDLVVVSLGITTDKNTPAVPYIGWTINIAPQFKVPLMFSLGTLKSKQKVRWDFLTPDQQINYYTTTYFPKVVKPYFDKYYATFEQTKAGNIHAHLLCYDPVYTNDYDLTALRKWVRQVPTCIKHAGQSMIRHRALNFIHYTSKPAEWVDYMMKDVDLHTYPIVKYVKA